MADVTSQDIKDLRDAINSLKSSVETSSAASENIAKAVTRKGGSTASGRDSDKRGSDDIFEGSGISKSGFEALTAQATSLYTKLDSARASFSSFTGLVNEGMPTLRGYSSAVRSLGFEYGESARNLEKLVEEIPDFLNKTTEMQNSMAIQSARLAKLGVDFGTNAKNITTLTKTLGMAEDKTLHFNGTLFKFAQSLKQPPSIIFKDFGAALPKLIQFGKDAPRVFMETEVYAKKLGISVENLISQMDSFSTFEDAAQSAGELNVILKQNLFDTNEMLFASPSEKIEMFVDKFQTLKETTGKSFNDLDRFTQQQFAKSAKVDLDTLKKLSGLSKEEAVALAERKENIEMNADGTLSLQKAAAASVSTMDRLAAKKDQLTELTLPFLDIEDSLEASVAEVELLTRAFVGVVKTDEGMRDIIKTRMSQVAAGMLMDDSGLAKMGKNVTSLVEEIPVIGDAFSKVKNIFLTGVQSMVNGSKTGVQDTMSIQIGDTTIGEAAKAAGLTKERLAQMQIEFDARRKLALREYEGSARVAGATREQAKAFAGLVAEGAKAEAAFAKFGITASTDVINKVRKTQKDALKLYPADGTDLGEGFAKSLKKGAEAGMAEVVDVAQNLKDSKQFQEARSATNTALMEFQKQSGLKMNFAGGFSSVVENLVGSPTAPSAVGSPPPPAVAPNAPVQQPLPPPPPPAPVPPAPPVRKASGRNVRRLRGANVTVGGEHSHTEGMPKATTVNPVVNTFPTPNKELKEHIEDLKNKTDALNQSFGRTKSAISGLSFTSTETRNLQAIGDAMKKYADAVEKTKTLQTEQQKILETMKAMAQTFAGAKLEISLDSEVIGRKMAKAFKETATGGSAASTG